MKMNTLIKNMPEPAAGLSGLEQLTLSDYKHLLGRRKWVIILTALCIASATAVVVYFLPNVYRATTVILVDPRKVPDNYVAATTTTTVVDRLATLREQILSATRLGAVIDELDLYHDMKKTNTHDEIVERMRNDIEITVVSNNKNDRDLAAFSVAYSSHDASQAARVTNRLASLFIEENIKSREQQVMGTADFIDKELGDAHKDLDDKEHKIAQLRTRYVGELPQSETMHVQALNSLQLELRSEMDEFNRAQQQKLYIQSLLAQNTPVVDLDRSASPELVALQAQLSDAQTELDDMRKRYGPEYPDVAKRQGDVQDLERQIKKVKEASASTPKPAAPRKAQNPVMESQIAALDQEIRKIQQRQEETKQEIAFHESKLGGIPVVEQQMAAATRDFDVARDHYRMLLEKKFGADMASDLESRQKAERFVILDPAQVPAKPDRPNRFLIDLVALVVGIGIGFGAALMTEIADPAIKTEREIMDWLAGPIIAKIPWFQTPIQRQRQIIRNLVLTASSTALAAAYVFMLVLSTR